MFRLPWRRPKSPVDDLQLRIAELTGVASVKKQVPSPLSRILVATDGTATGTTAVEWASWLAAKLEADLSILSVSAPQAKERHSSSDSSLLFETGLASPIRLDDSAAIARRHGNASPRLEVRSGDAAQEIHKASKDWNADLLVLGSGRLRREFRGLGSTAQQLLRTVHCHVLIARPFAQPTCLLAAVDGSQPSVHAALVAHELANRLDTPLSLLYVRPLGPPSKPELSPDPRWSHPGVSINFQTDAGRPAPTILERARLDHASMIVLGSKGMTAAPGWSLGGVSDEVARLAEQTVLIVKRAVL